MRDHAAIDDGTTWQDSLEWSAWHQYTNKSGERRARRSAEPNQLFWRAWQDEKDAIKRAGYSLDKWRDAWQVVQWAAVGANGSLIASGGPQELPQRNSGVCTHGSPQSRPTPSQQSQARRASTPPPVQIPERAIERTALPIADVEPVVPRGKKLMDHQHEDVRRCVAMRRVLLANPMGLGKTIVAAVTARTIGAERILVIAPKALLHNWEYELGEWLVGGANCLLVETKNADKIPTHDGPIIVNYELAAKAHVLKHLLAETWDIVIFDECQAFNNHESQRTENLIGPGGIEAHYALLMSGTPFKNRPIEVWPILRYLEPERWGSRHAFGLRYCAAKFDHLNNAWDYRGSSNLTELNAILHSSVMIRRDKSVQELPPLRHDVILLAPSAEQEELVQREHALNRAAKTGNLRADQLVEMFGADDVTIEGAMATVRKNLAMSKVDAAIQHIEHLVAHGEPVVAFVHHRECGDALEEHFGDRCVRVVGGRDAKKTRKAVEDFQTEDGPPVAIVSIRAGGAGITLTRSRVMVCVEADWSPGQMDQAYGRTWRIGQERPVHVQHLVVDGSLDKILYGVVARKGRASAEAFAS